MIDALSYNIVSNSLQYSNDLLRLFLNNCFKGLINPYHLPLHHAARGSLNHQSYSHKTGIRQIQLSYIWKLYPNVMFDCITSAPKMFSIIAVSHSWSSSLTNKSPKCLDKCFSRQRSQSSKWTAQNTAHVNKQINLTIHISELSLT